MALQIFNDNSNISKIKKLEINTLYIMIDRLVTELNKKMSAYDSVSNIFGFITKLDQNYYLRHLLTFSSNYLKMILIKLI